MSIMASEMNAFSLSLTYILIAPDYSYICILIMHK